MYMLISSIYIHDISVALTLYLLFFFFFLIFSCRKIKFPIYICEVYEIIYLYSILIKKNPYHKMKNKIKKNRRPNTCS